MKGSDGTCTHFLLFTGELHRLLLLQSHINMVAPTRFERVIFRFKAENFWPLNYGAIRLQSDSN